ncbi:MAG: YqhA family protein [Mariprofundus sp.]|nr:YqhA family protein [Mariprofundus sp.]
MKVFFEKLLWNARYLTILAVLSCIVGMAMLFTLAAIDMGKLLIDFINVYGFGQEYPDFHTEVVSHVITAVDDFLLAMVLLIFGFGIYELHIKKLDIAYDDPATGKLLQVESLDDLKNRLGKVILMILIVTFFKVTLQIEFDTPLDILMMGGAICLVSLAGYFGHKADQNKQSE